tara:strand:+ start:158 stop:406 length:249 start_codon:yes stop_codon:yes gene_type:complete
MYNNEIINLVQEMLDANANKVKQELLDLMKYQPAHDMTIKECSQKMCDVLERLAVHEDKIVVFNKMKDRLANVEQTIHLARD